MGKAGTWNQTLPYFTAVGVQTHAHSCAIYCGYLAFTLDIEEFQLMYVFQTHRMAFLGYVYTYGGVQSTRCLASV